VHDNNKSFEKYHSRKIEERILLIQLNREEVYKISYNRAEKKT